MWQDIESVLGVSGTFGDASLIANMNTPSPDYSPNSSICNSDMICTLPNASPTQSSVYVGQQLSYKAGAVKADPYAMGNDLLMPQNGANQASTQSNGHHSPSNHSPKYQPQTHFIDQQVQDQANNGHYSMPVKSEPSTKFDLMANTPPPSPENQKQLQPANGFTGDYPPQPSAYAVSQWQSAANQSVASQSAANQPSSLDSHQAENQISNQISVQLAGRPLDSPSSSNSSTSSGTKKLKSEKQPPAIVHQYVHLNNIVINSLSVNNSLQINQQNNLHLPAAAATPLNASSQPVQTSSSSYHCNPLYVYTHQNNPALDSYPQPMPQSINSSINSSSSHSSNPLGSQLAGHPASSQLGQQQPANNLINRTASGYYSPANSMYLRQLEEEQHLLTTVHPMLHQSNGYPYEMNGVQATQQQFNAQYGSNMTANMTANMPANMPAHEYTPDDYQVNQLDELNNCPPVNSNCSFINTAQCQQRLPGVYNDGRLQGMPIKNGMTSLASLQMNSSPVNSFNQFVNNPVSSQPNNQMNEQNASISSLPIQAAAVSTTKSRRGRKARGPKKITQHFCNYNNCGKCYSKSSHLKGRLPNTFR